METPTATATSSKPIRIHKLEIEAFKRISAVELEFDDDQGLIQITGRNEQGKSSVLDAISAALGGKALCPDQPIRQGYQKGSVSLDLGEYVVERTFALSGNSNLKITAKDGTPFKSPQEMLDKLFANLSFDPFKFMRMEPRQQVDELKKVAGLTEQLAALELKIREATETRLVAGRTLKLATANRAAVPALPNGPDQETLVEDLLNQIEQAESQKAENAGRRREADNIRAVANKVVEEIGRVDAEIKIVEQRLADLRELRTTKLAEYETAKADFERLSPVVAALVDPNTDAIRAQIRDVDAQNKLARDRQAVKARAIEANAQLTIAETAHATAVREVDRLTADRQMLLQNARFPVPGLGFNELGPTLDGIPLSQASTAQQLRTSTLMVLAQNSQAKIMTIREGALLDSGSREVLRQIAEEHGAQIFLEVATDGQQIGIVIEDGMVKEAVST